LLDLNKQLKGGVINIFPLSLIDDMELKLRRYPDAADAAPLKNFITLKAGSDARLLKLIDSFFSKVVLVKDYATAMNVAKDYNLTCITRDLQVVYAGAFITKVGHYNKN
jgi:chromosome segregation ATPase